MKAVIYKQYGRPEVLEMIEVPLLIISDHEVLVRGKVIGLNPKDVFLRRAALQLITGQTHRLPFFGSH
jgi:NADPH:quinone reductase-like Zn-dependent oxidoreductase